MTILQWTADLELGVPELDAQHRNLVELAAELGRHVIAGAPPEQSADAVRRLAQATAEHFAHEEGMMLRSDFDHDRVHREQHGELLGQLERFGRRLLERARPEESGRAVAFLRDWLTHHIRHSDRRFAEHLAVVGLTDDERAA